MTYINWHWRILCDPDVLFGLDREIWRHIFWLVEQEKHAMMKWDRGRWMDKRLFNELIESVKEAGQMKHDNVSHPKHYTGHASGIECIQITEHMNFCRGNAIKYIWRAGEKGSELEDLHKAKWYIEREIQRLMGSPAIQQDAQHEQEEWERVTFGQSHAD